MAKTSIKAAVRTAKSEDRKARAAKTQDSFQNFSLGLGIGTNNASSGNMYGFNPISRNRIELEWMHRGSWVAGVAVDTIANDMTRAGVELKGELQPDEIEEVEEAAVALRIWERVNHTIKWSRLYGGCIAVLLVDGQDYSKPFRVETVGQNQFKGLLVLDRWMVAPSLNDLVTEIGPELGHPKFYSVLSAAPALRGMKIHHSRCLRLIGDELPYWQAMAEQLWGMSVLERLYDRLTAFDNATTGASQLVYKSYLRYFQIDKYRDILSAGGPALKGLQEMVQNMRMFASNEGITLMDTKDNMVTTQASTFGGIAECLLQFGQQISGALQIPLVRLFGQSPAGLNSSGDSDLRTYYDGIKQRQELGLRVAVTRIYRCIAQSLGIDVGDGFSLDFRPLWQLDEIGKAEVAQRLTQTVLAAAEAGQVSDQIVARELQQIAKLTGVWSNVSDEFADQQSDEVLPPAPEDEPALPSGNGGPESQEQVDRGEHREEEEVAA